MVAPTAFLLNVAAALDNHFMHTVPALGGVAAQALTPKQQQQALQHKILEEYSELHRYAPASGRVCTTRWQRGGDC